VRGTSRRPSEPHESRARCIERYALGTVSAKQLEAETGLAASRIGMILMNPLYNGWIRRHRGKNETRRLAPWRATPPVSDERWARVEEVRRAKTRGGGPKNWDRVDLLGALEHAAGGLGDDTYLTRLRALRQQRDAIADSTSPGLPSKPAVEWLRRQRWSESTDTLGRYALVVRRLRPRGAPVRRLPARRRLGPAAPRRGHRHEPPATVSGTVLPASRLLDLTGRVALVTASRRIRTSDLRLRRTTLYRPSYRRAGGR
jgi:hypothetical protein